MMKYYSIIWLLILTVGNRSFASIPDTTMEKLLRIETAIFHSYNNDSIFNLLYNKAIVYKTLKMYKEALATLERKSPSKDHFLYEKYIFQKALLFFFINDFGNAWWTIQEYAGTSDEWVLLKLKICLENEDFKTAKGVLYEYYKAKSLPGENLNILPDSLLAKDPLKYKRMSTWLPGLGQTLAGYPVKGITAFTLNTAFAGLSIWCFVNGYFITGSFSGIMPFYRFYRGNRLQTFHLIENLNHKKTKELSDLYYKEFLKLKN